jgi:hypothetical protein
MRRWMRMRMVATEGWGHSSWTKANFICASITVLLRGGAALNLRISTIHFSTKSHTTKPKLFFMETCSCWTLVPGASISSLSLFIAHMVVHI